VDEKGYLVVGDHGLRTSEFASAGVPHPEDSKQNAIPGRMIIRMTMSSQAQSLQCFQGEKSAIFIKIHLIDRSAHG